MTDNERRLLELIRERSFQRGNFRLASGDTSPYYIDGKMTEVFSEGAYLIGEVLYERTKDLNVQGIGGLEVGAVPLTTAAVISYHHHGRKMDGFWVRDEKKSHGTQKQIEGRLSSGSRLIIVDDVITRGKSTEKAIIAVRSMGCDVVAVVALLDRLAGAEELFDKLGVSTYIQVFTIRDLGVDVDVSRAPQVAAR